MKKVFLLGLSLMSMLSAGAQMYPRRDYVKLANYDESKVPEYKLPDVLMCEDGEVVTTKEMWEQKRRPEVLNLFTTYMFGKAPVLKNKLPYKVERVSKKALNGRATRKEITVQLTEDPQGPCIHLQLYLPNQVKGKVPVFLGLSFMPNYTIYNDEEVELPAPKEGDKWKPMRGSMNMAWQLDKILEQGYGLATFCYNDVDPDFDDDFKNGVHPYYYKKNQDFPAPDEWGSIAAWAWGASRALDYLETDSKVDAKKVAVIGHSRLGKAAVWAGASDTRFALVISGNSGCCGVAISRRVYGETVEAMNVRFPHWFCGNYKQFNDRERYMPFDQHELVALIAPRPIYIASAEDDNWSDQKGEFLGGKGAEPVYALYGLPGIGTDEMPPLDTPYMQGSIAYHNRKGTHAILPYDWEQFLLFANRFWK